MPYDFSLFDLNPLFITNINIVLKNFIQIYKWLTNWWNNDQILYMSEYDSILYILELKNSQLVMSNFEVGFFFLKFIYIVEK